MRQKCIIKKYYTKIFFITVDKKEITFYCGLLCMQLLHQTLSRLLLRKYPDSEAPKKCIEVGQRLCALKRVIQSFRYCDVKLARPMTELKTLHCIIMGECALTFHCRHSELLHQLINTLWNDITHIMRFQCANDFVISRWPSLLFVNIPNCISQLSLNGLPP